MRLRRPLSAPLHGLGPFALLALIVLILPTLANAAVHNGTINGDEAQATTCSLGSTTQVLGTVTYDDASGLFSWDYTYGENAPSFDDGGLFGGGTATVAHFHGPAAPGFPAGVRVTASAATPASGSTTISSAFGTELLGELWYLNIHSLLCGGGEVRGQVLFAQAVPSVSYPAGGALVLLLGGIAFFAMKRMTALSASPRLNS